MAQPTTSPFSETIEAPGPAPRATTAVFRILVAVTVCHLLNDMVQSLLPSIYPILKSSFHLNFSQTGFQPSVFSPACSQIWTGIRQAEPPSRLRFQH